MSAIKHALQRTSAAVVAVNGDPIGLTINSDTPAVTAPTNNIAGGGYTGMATFKGMAIGQTLDATKISFDAYEPANDATGAAIAGGVARHVTGTVRLRMPVPSQWITGEVVAIGDKRINRISSVHCYQYRATTAGTTGASAPVHVAGTVSDGTVSWAFESDTTANDSPPTKAIEVTSGADAQIWFVFDKYVSTAAIITNVVFAVNAYGASRASTSSLLTVTNNSPLVAPKCAFHWLMMPHDVYGDTVHVEAYVEHPYFKNSRQVAAVWFRVYDDAGGYTGVNSMVSAQTGTTIGTTTYGNYAEVVAADLNMTGQPNGVPYWIRATVYPWVGTVWDSDTDGFGPTSGAAFAVKQTANVSKRIPFIKDSSAYTQQIAFIDPSGGNDATAAVATTLANAKLTPFQTLNAVTVGALTKLQTANGGVLDYKTAAYIKDGATMTGSSGSLTLRTYGKSSLKIAREPGGVAVTTITADLATAANRNFSGRIHFEDLDLVGGTSAVIANGAVGSIGDFHSETVLRRCRINGVGGQPMQTIGLMWAVNCLFTSIGSIYSNNRSALAISVCCTYTGSGADAPQIPSVVNIGCKMAAKAVPSTSVANVLQFWNENGQKLYSTAYVFTTWMTCLSNVALHSLEVTHTASYSVSFIEACAASVKGGQISGDAALAPIPYLYCQYSGSAGDGMNITYLDRGTVNAVKRLFLANYAGPDLNMKGEYYFANDLASAVRTGTFAARNHVDCFNNVMTNITLSTPSATNNAGEVKGTGEAWLTTGLYNYVNMQAKTTTGGTGAGGGDYRPTNTSSFYGKIGATEQGWVRDLNGNLRDITGFGAVGPFEHN